MKKLSLVFTMLLLASLGYAKENKVDTVKMKNLDEVIISASRTNAKLKELPAKVEVITSKAISQSTANDMADLLKNNTSVDVIQYPNFLSGIGMRGFAPGTNTKYVTVLVDGVPAGTMNMSTLMTNGVQQVEILKGPFSSLYGSSAMGGLINIVPMQNKGELTGNVSVSYGSWNTAKVAANVGGKIMEGLSFDVNAFYKSQKDDYKIGNDNFNKITETEKAILDKSSYGATMKKTSYNAQGGNLRLGYDFNDNWKINVYGSYFGTGNIVTNGSFFETNSPQKKDMKNYTTRLSVEGKVQNHSLKINPYYSYAFYDYASVNTDYKTSEYTTKTYGVQLQDVITLGDHKLTLGIDNQNTNTESKNFEEKDGNEEAPYKPNYKNGTLGAFAQANFKLLDDRLNISAGARYDIIKLTLQQNSFLKNSEKSENYNKFSPNIGLGYKLTKNSTLHASYGQAFLAPDSYQKAGEYTTSGSYEYNGKTYYYKNTHKGNPNLKGESSSTFDVGLRYKNFAQGIDIDVTYFHTNHEDFIVRESVDPDGKQSSGDEYKTFKNAKEAKLRGVEIMTAYDFGCLVDYAFSLKAYINGTFMLHAKVLDEDWKNIKNIRKQTINFGLHFMTENKWSIKLNGRYIGSRIERNFYNPKVRPTLAKLAMESQPEYAKKGLLKHPDFMVFDAHIYYNINEHVTVGINANNLLNENYTEKDGYNMPGRNFIGKVSYNF